MDPALVAARGNISIQGARKSAAFIQVLLFFLEVGC